MGKDIPGWLPVTPTLEEEKRLWAMGYQVLAGLDEAGRGALAGPVAAGAVILPSSNDVSQLLSGVRDSKLMTPAQRSHWADEIKRSALAWSVGTASNLEIDDLGIIRATRLAMLRALQSLNCIPQYLLIDYVRFRLSDISQKAIVKGDRLCLSIAAASVLAKTYRDELMVIYDSQYPQYNFAHHKGYGTREHRLVLERIGCSEIHRKSFHVKQLLVD